MLPVLMVYSSENQSESLTACLSGSEGNDNPLRMHYEGLEHPIHILYPMSRYSIWECFAHDITTAINICIEHLSRF